MNNRKKADKIYEKIKEKLKGHEGEMVAIEVDSGDYFVGKDIDEACDSGEKKHPDKELYVKRIGFKYAYVIGAHPI